MGFLSLRNGAVGLMAFAALGAVTSGSVLAQDKTDQPQSDQITIDDLMALKRVASPKISPDGQWVAYTVSSTDMKANKSSTRLWIVSKDGATTLPMTLKSGSVGNPQWSPDGQFLAFTASRGGDDAKSQVWTLNMMGGEAEQYTNIDQGVSDYRWAPDGQSMVLIIKDKSQRQLAEEAAKKTGEKLPADPYVINRRQFKRDYVGYLDETRTHLYHFKKGDEAPRQLTFGAYDDSDPQWSPDGQKIAFVSNRTADPDSNDNSDIWIVDLGASEADPRLRQFTKNVGPDHSPAWSHDGQTIAYVTVTRPDIIWYATNHLAYRKTSGGDAVVLTTSLDRNVSNPVFAPDNQTVYFELEDAGTDQLARITLNSRAIERVFQDQASLRRFDMNAKGHMVALISRPHQTTNVSLIADDGRETRLTTLNDDMLAGKKLASVEKITFNSKDGTPVDGFLYLPAGYQKGQAYPTILRLHGGPVSQYDYGFNNDAQLLAAKGYVVLMPNPRGSSGYGQNFSLALWQKWGVRDFEDVMAGIDHLVAEGITDPDRLGVGGWSYGGMLTNYVITKSTRFKAAISGASEVLYRANYGVDHYQRHWEAELGLPWENAAAWEAISPFNDVAGVTTPTLVMGGQEDWNVPVMNSEQLYQALNRVGVETQLVVYPGEHHGFRKPHFIKDRYQRYVDWYDKYLK